MGDDYISIGSIESIDKELAALKSRIPEAKPAYVPSGILPLKGVALMVLGVVPSALAATLGAAVLLVLAALVRAWLGAGGKAAEGLLGVGKWFGTLLVMLVPYYGVAAVCVGFAQGFGRWGRSRSRAATRVFAVVYVCAGAAAYYLAGRQFCPSTRYAALDQVRSLFFSTSTTAIALAAVGLAFALAMAFFALRHLGDEAKFCETCREYMQPSMLPSVSFAGLQGIRGAAAGGDWCKVASLLSSSPGQTGHPLLTVCPKCGAAYFELSAWPVWKSSGGSVMAQGHWLVVSAPMAPDQAAPIRASADASAKGS